jgi:hypothetical protein
LLLADSMEVIHYPYATVVPIGGKSAKFDGRVLEVGSGSLIVALSRLYCHCVPAVRRSSQKQIIIEPFIETQVRISFEPEGDKGKLVRHIAKLRFGDGVTEARKG